MKIRHVCFYALSQNATESLVLYCKTCSIVFRGYVGAYRAENLTVLVAAYNNLPECLEAFLLMFGFRDIALFTTPSILFEFLIIAGPAGKID